MVAGGGQPEALGEVEATERSRGEKMMPESRAVAVMSMSYLKMIREEHQWDLMLAWLWGWEEEKLRTTPTFGASATGSIEAGGAVPPKMGGGWFLGFIRCSGIGRQVGDAL